jgi:hypothetical protein
VTTRQSGTAGTINQSMGMQNASRKRPEWTNQGARRGAQEAGTDVSWRNRASVQAGSSRQKLGGKGTTTRATMMADSDVLARARRRALETGQGPRAGHDYYIVLFPSGRGALPRRATATQLGSALGSSRACVVCSAWGGQLARARERGSRVDEGRRVHGDKASTRQRHVLAAPAKGIISGRRRPAMGRGAKPVVCVWWAACSMIHEPMEPDGGGGGQWWGIVGGGGGRWEGSKQASKHGAF